MADDFGELMRGLEQPAPLPSQVRASLRDALLRAGSGERVRSGGDVRGEGGEERDHEGEDMAALLAGVDAPRPLPAETRARVTAVLARPARRRVPVWVGIAAAIVLIAGGVAALAPRGGPRHSSLASRPPLAAGGAGTSAGGGNGNTAQGNAATGSGAIGLPPAVASPAVPPPPGVGGAASPGASGMGTAGPTFAVGPAPPFSSPTNDQAAAALPGPTGGAPPAGPAITVAVVPGDPAVTSGFDAYVAMLNQQGGINGHTIRVVTTSPGQPATGAVATVNLSGAAVTSSAGAPRWITAPVLEGLAVPEGALRGSVFDTSSAPSHQGVVAVNVMFPSTSSGKVAVIYRGAQGVWAEDVPTAMAGALRQRGVTPIVMAYTPGHLTTTPAAAVFLALDSADARAWFGDAARAGYHVPVAGIGSLVEPSVAAVMPDGTRAVGPYELPDDGERASLAAAIGTQPGMGAVHGWVTAKVLAVALWRSNATSAAAATEALAHMGGFDDGFAPPLAFRPGTTSRVPDGILFTAHGHSLQSSGTFLRDPA